MPVSAAYSGPYGYGGQPLEARVVHPTSGRPLAVAALVLGGLALLGVLLLVAFAFSVSFLGLGGAGGGSGYGPMRGAIAPLAGSPLGGEALAAEITRSVRDDGGDPEAVSCPATPTVARAEGRPPAALAKPVMARAREG